MVVFCLLGAVGFPAQAQTDTYIRDTETGEEVVRVDGYIPQGGVSGAVRSTLSGQGRDGGPPAGAPPGTGYPDGSIPEDQEVAILVKEGTVVYCAMSRQLLHYNVQWKQVPRAVAESGRYFDDGTNGDEVAYDGVPSRIVVVDDRYIGPEAWKNKLRLEAWVRQMGFPTRLEKFGYSNAKLKEGEMHPHSPLAFYSVPAVALDEQSEVSKLQDEKSRLEAYRTIVIDSFLAEYEGYEYYPDYTKPPKSGDRLSAADGGQTQFQLSRTQPSRGSDQIWRAYEDGRQTMRAGTAGSR